MQGKQFEESIGSLLDAHLAKYSAEDQDWAVAAKNVRAHLGLTTSSAGVLEVILELFPDASLEQGKDLIEVRNSYVACNFLFTLGTYPSYQMGGSLTCFAFRCFTPTLKSTLNKSS